MTERSRSFTDLKIWIQSLISVIILTVGGYFGVTTLAPQSAAPSQEAQAGATLEAYSAPQPSDVQDADATPEGEDEAMQGAEATQALDAAQESDATQTAGEEPAAAGDGGQDSPDADAAGTMETPQPPASEPTGANAAGSQGGARPGAPGDGAPGARLTEIAQGTLLPAEPASGEDARQELYARMTAIAQGTLRPGDQTGAAAAATPVPTTLSVEEPATVAAPTEGSAASPTSGATGGSAGQPTASGQVSAGGAALPAASRLFAVTRGAGAELYDRPDGDVVSDLVAGSALTALARSDDGLWALVQGTAGAGWVPADQLVLFGAENLPVLSDLETAPAPGGQTPAPAASAVAPAQQTPALTAGQPAEPAAEAAPILGDYIEPVLATVASLNNRLNVRSGPGTDSPIVERVNPGEQYIALARTAVGDWVQIALPETEEGAGWVSTDFVELSGGIDALPSLDAAADGAAPADGTAPAALPTPTPIEPGASTGTAPSAADVGASAAQSAGGTAALTADELALRKGPGADFDIEQSVDAAADYIELDRTADGAWTRIGILDWPGGIGWVLTDQLQRSAPADSTQTGPAIASGANEVSGAAASTPGSSTDAGALPATSTEAEPEATVPASGEPAADAAGALTPEQLASVAGTAFPEPVVATVATQGARLNVRTGPGTDFDIIERLDPGMVRTALAQNAAGDWTRIASPLAPDGEAWVATRFVQLGSVASTVSDDVAGAPPALPSPPATADAVLPVPPLTFGADTLSGPAQATVNAGGATVNIRSGPGPQFATIGQAPSGARFAASARSVLADWVQVKLSDAGAFGWLPVESVNLDAPIMLLPTAGPDLEPPPAFVESLTWGAPPAPEDVNPLQPAEGAEEPEEDSVQYNLQVERKHESALELPDPPRFLPVVGANGS